MSRGEWDAISTLRYILQLGDIEHNDKTHAAQGVDGGLASLAAGAVKVKKMYNVEK